MFNDVDTRRIWAYSCVKESRATQHFPEGYLALQSEHVARKLSQHTLSFRREMALRPFLNFARIGIRDVVDGSSYDAGIKCRATVLLPSEIRLTVNYPHISPHHEAYVGGFKPLTTNSFNKHNIYDWRVKLWSGFRARDLWQALEILRHWCKREHVANTDDKEHPCRVFNSRMKMLMNNSCVGFGTHFQANWTVSDKQSTRFTDDLIVS